MSRASVSPELIVSRHGVSIMGLRNVVVERESPDGLIAPVIDAGTVPNLKFPYAQAHNRVLSGGWARDITTESCRVASEMAGVNMRLTRGGIRELHWHKEAEWAYMIAGGCRVSLLQEDGRLSIDDVSTVFASGGKARTFDHQAGDVRYVSFAMGHYVQNTGDQTLMFLEMFRADLFADISLSRWMGVLSPKLVKAHLNLADDVIAALPRTKPIAVRGA
jgi:oxalate decarboxylase